MVLQFMAQGSDSYSSAICHHNVMPCAFCRAACLAQTNEVISQVRGFSNKGINRCLLHIIRPMTALDEAWLMRCSKTASFLGALPGTSLRLGLLSSLDLLSSRRRSGC